jgi:hypothetical protein
MSDLQWMLTSAECRFLEDLLDRVLKARLIAEHCTRTPNFREYIR